MEKSGVFVNALLFLEPDCGLDTRSLGPGRDLICRRVQIDPVPHNLSHSVGTSDFRWEVKQPEHGAHHLLQLNMIKNALSFNSVPIVAS
jgi:hypothetical protein